MTNKPTETLKKALAFLKSPRGESVRYLIIGGCTTLVDYCTHYFFTVVLHMNFNISNFTSTALAIVFAYVANKLIVFVSRTKTFRAFIIEFFKFIGSRLLTMGLEIGSGYLFVDVLGQNGLVGKAEAIIIVIIANYFLSKFFVFRKNRDFGTGNHC